MFRHELNKQDPIVENIFFRSNLRLFVAALVENLLVYAKIDVKLAKICNVVSLIYKILPSFLPILLVPRYKS